VLCFSLTKDEKRNRIASTKMRLAEGNKLMGIQGLQAQVASMPLDFWNTWKHAADVELSCG
jgi:hypothetical protein